MHQHEERPRKRVRILSSMNPASSDDGRRPADARQASPSSPPPLHSPHQEHHKPRPSEDAPAADHVHRSSKPTKFRFKDPSRRSRHRKRHEDDGDNGKEDPENRHRSGGSSSKRSHRHRSDGDHHHHRHHRHRRRRHHDHAAAADAEPEDTDDPLAAPALDADAAFRESLFDAMADDEGAAYWEGVYGQPIHTYGRAGELEQMTEDEYAAHIRARMWEKTHAGLLEAREQRRRDRERDRADRARRAADAGEVAAALDARLSRGHDRRLRRAWKDRCARYRAAWDAAPLSLLAGDAWPVESARREDVSEARVREFFTQAVHAHDGSEDRASATDGEAAGGLAARLKEERVRWHPDKIQQRLGGSVDDDLMRDVTAVFQIVDSLWANARSQEKKTSQ